MSALEKACEASLRESRKARARLRWKWFGIGLLFAVCVVYAAERWL
jgi:hypothetical protein